MLWLRATRVDHGRAYASRPVRQAVQWMVEVCLHGEGVWGRAREGR